MGRRRCDEDGMKGKGGDRPEGGRWKRGWGGGQGSHSPLPQVRSAVVPGLHVFREASGKWQQQLGATATRDLPGNLEGPWRSLLEGPLDPGIQQLVWLGHLGFIPIWKFL